MDKVKTKIKTDSDSSSSTTDTQSQTPVDAETILLTLDQIGQTIDVMNKVVGRLRGYVNTHLTQKDENPLEKRILH